MYLYRFFNSLLLLLISSALISCASRSDIKSEAQTKDIFEILDLTVLGQKPKIDAIDKVLLVDSEEKARFLEYYQSNTDIRGHHRIYDYLEERLGSFSYYGKTYSANETL